MTFTIEPGKLTITDCRNLLADRDSQIALSDNAYQAIHAAHAVIKNIIESGQVVYGINTGFGSLASTHIDESDLTSLQEKIVLSHAAGTGDYMCDDTVRLLLLLKINSLARGYSGVQASTVDALITLYNKKVYPCVPAKGSVGASGDLAPLAHLVSILIGAGEARYKGKIISAKEALKTAGLSPVKLAPKEGLALLNGTQASTALALQGLFATENLLATGLVAGAMSVDAACGSDKPFDDRIHAVRGHKAQQQVAKVLRHLLADSSIRSSHLACHKVQDPYSLRCQPQVMGACLQQLWHARDVLITEANAVSDNPLVFAEQNEIISGGNFHAEPVGFAADGLALSLAEIGSISERRISLLVDSHFSGLPSFLVNNPGLNSGFMIAQCTAAALASENKSHAHPGVVDNIPTSANQEDHVSMATYAARRLQEMADNTAGILAIELLAAAQGLDFHQPLHSSAILEAAHKKIRKHVAFYDEDRFFAPDIKAIKDLILSGELRQHAELDLLTS